MLALLDTGVRVSELCGLRLDDIDLSNGYLIVMGKGQRERYVPIGAKLTKALLKYKLSHRAEAMERSSNFWGRDILTACGKGDSLWALEDPGRNNLEPGAAINFCNLVKYKLKICWRSTE